MKIYTNEELKAMDKETRRELRKEMDNVLNGAFGEEWDTVYGMYCALNAIEDEEYREENEEDFLKYEREHICGHTDEELTLGNNVCSLAYDLYAKLPAEKKTGYVFEKSLDEYYIKAYTRAQMEYTEEEVRKAYEFANDWGYYSDWHKDMYGFRPRRIPA